MFRQWFRLGLRIGLLLGVSFALLRTIQARRSRPAPGDTAPPAGEPWPRLSEDTPPPWPPITEHPSPAASEPEPAATPPVDEVGEPLVEPVAPPGPVSPPGQESAPAGMPPATEVALPEPVTAQPVPVAYEELAIDLEPAAWADVIADEAASFGPAPAAWPEPAGSDEAPADLTAVEPPPGSAARSDEPAVGPHGQVPAPGTTAPDMADVPPADVDEYAPDAVGAGEPALPGRVAADGRDPEAVLDVEPVAEPGPAGGAERQPVAEPEPVAGAEPVAEPEPEMGAMLDVEVEELLEEAAGTPPTPPMPSARPAKAAKASKAPATRKATKATNAAKAVKKATKKAARPAARPTPAWVEPDDGACPSTHPVKAKLASRLFHLPGMFAYARTRADRCYRDGPAAEQDGFTRAKR
ncbi:MAG TPA: hypothetical protein VFO65_02650 [Acidimicrobiales bacterium]|nr:hypothetical protein [Acidimicrobiales bacterium]